jgi:hypothetical protein
MQFNKMKELTKTLDREELMRKLAEKATHDKWTNVEVSEDLRCIRRKI